MKKLLIATTALVITAGVAAAEVTVTSESRFGVIYDGEDTNFTTRIRVIFGLSGETDGGLSFGGSIRADQMDSGINKTGPSGVLTNGDENTGAAGSLFISGAFGRLAVGDVAGAAEAAIGDLDGVGLTGLGDYSDTVFLTGDGVENGPNNPIFLYSYSTSGFSFYLSANDGRIEGGSLGSDLGEDVNNYSAAVGYEFGDYSVGLGYESSDPVSGDASDLIIVSGQAGFGGTSVKALYGEGNEETGDLSQYGISATGTIQAAVVTGFYKYVETNTTETEAFGIGASYDLGGGASLKGGVVNYDVDTVGAVSDDETVADFGINFKF